MRMTRLSIIAVMLCTLLASCSVNPPPMMLVGSEQNDYIKGWTQGLMDAKPNRAWGAAGIGCGIFGVGAAYWWNYQPPIVNLVGKSEEYIVAYTEAYQQKMRNENAKQAAIGWGAFLAFYSLFYYRAYID